MNILYIGPYRQLDYIGQVSNLHIESIKKSISKQDQLAIRPIFLDTSLASSDKAIQDAESVTLDTIDVIIQYVPINWIAINLQYKNIVIPMLDPKIYNISHDYNYKILNFCDKILVEEDKNKNLLKYNGVKKPIEIYEENIKDNKFQQFNLTSSESIYTYGFIGQYDTNKQIVQKIINSFLISTRYNYNNTKLVLFLRGSEKSKSELEFFISEAKKELHIARYMDTISTVFGMWPQDEAITALNSINCFISLNDDYRYYVYEKFFMHLIEKEDNRFLISRNNTQSIETPIVSLKDLYEYKNSISSISTQDLLQKIISAPQTQTQKFKKQHLSSLGSIVCKQTL